MRTSSDASGIPFLRSLSRKEPISAGRQPAVAVLVQRSDKSSLSRFYERSKPPIIQDVLSRGLVLFHNTENCPDLRVQVMARGAFQIVEVKLPLRQPFVRVVRVVTFQTSHFSVFSGELVERNAVMGIVAGIAYFLGDLSVKAF